jgi:hypothetical protein
MGFKSGKRNFTGTLKAAILKAIGAGGLSKNQLVHNLRAKAPALRPSLRRVQEALRQLLDAGRIEKLGQRARARFSRA